MSGYWRLVRILVTILFVLSIVAIIMLFNIPEPIDLDLTEPTTYPTIPTISTEPTTPETEETIPPTETFCEPTEPTETTEVTETTPPYDEDELEMLALVIYQEAGGNMYCDECRRRVADVVLNRVADDRFPETMYEVLTQPKQYGRLSQTGLVWPERALFPSESEAVDRAYVIAEQVLLGWHSDLYGRGYIWQAEFKQGRDNIYCCGHYFGR